MKFLITQIIVVALVCVFVVALSNLTELGGAGWLITASTGYALYRVFKQIDYNLKLAERKEKSKYNNFEDSDFSAKMLSLSKTKTSSL